MRHLNSIVKRAASLRARLDAVGRRRAAFMENYLTDCRECADIAIEWATTIRPWVLANVGRGKAEDAWCKANMGCALRTLQAHLQIAKPENWPTYVKERRKRGDCGRYGTEFALELLAKPRDKPETKRGGSASGNGKGTRGKGGPAGQNTRTPLPVFRYLDRAVGGYGHDLCAHCKKVALCESFSRDYRKADVRGKCVFCNGPFGLNAELAAYLRDCGARHVTWLTTAAVNSRWFHQDVLPFASRIFLPDRRVRFVNHDNVSKYDTMLVVHGEVPKELDALATHSILCSGIRLP